MKRTDLERALLRAGCVLLRQGGRHTVWACTEECGQHKVAVPRHSEIKAGVVGSIMKTMTCLEEGWLQ
jgi:predicted RNA binding protein YcfA (HicA-like mRNA interferase family)